MKILKPVSKSPIDAPLIPEKISAEISVIIEISVILYFFSIIEYQIYSPIFSILQTVFGQNTEKSKKTDVKESESHYIMTNVCIKYNISGFLFSDMKQRGFPEIIDDDPFVDPYPEQPLGYFIVQMDKSTCQTYNLKSNFLGYGAFRRFEQHFCSRRFLKVMEFLF